MFLDGGVEAWTKSMFWDNIRIYGISSVVDQTLCMPPLGYNKLAIFTDYPYKPTLLVG